VDCKWVREYGVDDFLEPGADRAHGKCSFPEVCLDVVLDITNNLEAPVPRTKIIFFKVRDGSVPLFDWADSLEAKAREQCFIRLERLEAMGHELRRPEAENLGNGLYELRAKSQGVNLRMLYFFHGSAAVVVTHGLKKQRARVPLAELELAQARRRAFLADPMRHSYEGSR